MCFVFFAENSRRISYALDPDRMCEEIDLCTASEVNSQENQEKKKKKKKE